MTFLDFLRMNPEARRGAKDALTMTASVETVKDLDDELAFYEFMRGESELYKVYRPYLDQDGAVDEWPDEEDIAAQLQWLAELYQGIRDIEWEIVSDFLKAGVLKDVPALDETEARKIRWEDARFVLPDYVPPLKREKGEDGSRRQCWPLPLEHTFSDDTESAKMEEDTQEGE